MQVSDLFNFAASDTKGRFTSPTADSTEWHQWLSWANEELRSFAEVHDWSELASRGYTIQLSGVSGALPSNFKKIAGYPNLDGTLLIEGDGDLFQTYATDADVFRTGFENGWFVETRQAGTTLVVPFYSYPTALATTTDNINVRNPMYLVKRLKVRIFKYRQDPIFTEMESEANLMLQQMIENEFYKHSQYRGGATTREEEAGFSLGED